MISNYPSEPTPVFATLTKTVDRGTIPDHAIYRGYTVAGWMFEQPVIGKHFWLLRTKRNDVAALGIFESSTIESLVKESPTRWSFTTKNSIYVLDLHYEVEYTTIPLSDQPSTTAI